MTLARHSALSAIGWLLRRYVRPFWPAIGFMTAATLVGNLLTVLQPAILAGLLASLSATASSSIPENCFRRCRRSRIPLVRSEAGKASPVHWVTRTKARSTSVLSSMLDTLSGI